MGFFSSIAKGVKNVFGGIMKVFSPILAPLAKMMDTGWGKALMIALSIFTMGSAFVAAQAVYQGAIAAGQSMLSAFVQGGVEFVKVFLGAEASGAQVSAGAGTAVGSTGVTNAEAFMGAGEAVQGLDAANKIAETGAATIKGAGELVAGAGSGAATGAGVGSGAAAGAGNTAKVAGAATQAGPTQALADAGGKLATETSGNWLTKAANDAWDWAKKDDFKNTKDLISGYSEYEDREDVQRHQDRYSRRWRKDTEGLEALSQIGTGDQPRFSPGGPGQTLDRNRRGFQPTIPYRGKGQPQGAGG
jgi:hypothetical protein